MYPALLMMFAFPVLAACLRERAVGERRLFGTIGLRLATMSIAIIAVDYFIQLQTVPPALLLGEGESLAAVSQYNPHGIFITLENLSFLVLSLSFAFFALTLGPSRLERATRWIYVGCAAVAAVAFVGLWTYFGFRLEYFFEVALISVVWLALIVSGGLLAVFFRRSTAA